MVNANVEGEMEVDTNPAKSPELNQIVIINGKTKQYVVIFVFMV